MVRYLILAAVCLFVVGCWAFEKTDERPTPISEALGDAAVAFEQGVKQAPPIPGPSGWILGLLFGGTAAVAAFVTLKEGFKPSDALAEALKEHVVRKIGAIARPDQILFSADLPKTRSGKIMRRLLRDIAEGKALGDTSTLADPAVVARLKTQYEEKEG